MLLFTTLAQSACWHSTLDTKCSSRSRMLFIARERESNRDTNIVQLNDYYLVVGCLCKTSAERFLHITVNNVLNSRFSIHFGVFFHSLFYFFFRYFSCLLFGVFNVFNSLLLTKIKMRRKSISCCLIQSIVCDLGMRCTTHKNNFEL